MVAVVSGIWLHNVLRPRYDTASQEDVFAFSCYFFGAICCLGMSATYHAISNHSPEVSRFGNQLDYLGIVSLIWGSFVPSIYYGFQGDVFWVRTYWSMVRLLQQIHRCMRNLLINLLDHDNRSRLRNGLHKPQVPNPKMASLPRRNVHRHGILSSHPRSPRYHYLWHPPDEPLHQSSSCPRPRPFLRCWSRSLCQQNSRKI